MVIKVQMYNDRRRTRAMKIAAAADGTYMQASNSILYLFFLKKI
jgi:hypothetical protein